MIFLVIIFVDSIKSLHFYVLKKIKMSFTSLPMDKFHKNTEKMKLKNFPAGYVGRFHGRFASNIKNFVGSDFCGRIANDAKYSFQKHPKIYTCKE